MRPLAEMDFYVDTTKRGKFIGRVGEFPDLKTKAHKSRLDAIDEIVSLAAERIRDIFLQEAS